MGGAAAIIVAAGRGERAGEGLPKPYRPLSGAPVIRRTIEAFAARPEISAVVVVIAEGHRPLYDAAVAGLAHPPLVAPPLVVLGGATRTASVRAGLEALAKAAPEFVLIHDAARPFAAPALIDRVEAGLLGADGIVPALPIADAIKAVDAQGRVGGDAPRSALRAVQTPQGFRYGPLLEAYRALAADADLPDDAAVAREAGLVVRTTPGDPENTKLTFPDDFARAEARLAGGWRRFAAGHGFDAHRIGPGEGVTLCGVLVPAPFGLIGHSDADVGLHALTDAILGALGEADIGEHFPPSDPQWRGADSKVFLRHARGLAARDGAEILHADVTLICERPKVKPHRAAMRAAIAETLSLELNRVSVKATTTEKLGFLGRGEGLAAMATATLAWR
jgi:2-C-methyl-D-erythritol 4-phosphate cytidylyltransferase/2-C-methyl-D-erythritol 2,4-cyclodiphosphate synthase